MEYSLKHANNNIKLLLKYKGWTQDVLCKKTGITSITLRRRLNGDKSNWTMTEGVAIAKAFGVSVSDLFFAKMVPSGNSNEMSNKDGN